MREERGWAALVPDALVGVRSLAGLAGRQALLTCPGKSRSPALGSGRNFPPGHIGSSAWGFFAFLCSIEQGPLPRLLWALAGQWLPALAAPRHQLCPAALSLCLPWGKFVAGAQGLPLLPRSWGVLACTRQHRVFGKAAGWRCHEELPLVICACLHTIKAKCCCPLLGVLFVLRVSWLWPESLLLQLRCQVPCCPRGMSCRVPWGVWRVGLCPSPCWGGGGCVSAACVQGVFSACLLAWG